MDCSKKKTNRVEMGRGGGRLRIWNLQWYQTNSIWNFQGLIKNDVEFPRATKEKFVEFPGVLVSWFLTLEFPRDVRKICGISRGGTLLCLEFPGVK